MEKNHIKFMNLLILYSWIILKRGVYGLVSLLIANIITLLVKDTVIVIIIHMYCFLSIMMILLIDYKNEGILFKIYRIAKFKQRSVKLSIICLFLLIQGLVILILNSR